jgi:hypothetical protein
MDILDRAVRILGFADGHAVTAHGASEVDVAAKCEAPKAS